MVEDHFEQLGPERNAKEFDEAKQKLANQLGALARLSARFGHLEGQLLELDHWTRHHDPDCRLAGLSILQRAALIDWVGQELDELAKTDSDTSAPFPNAFDFGMLHEILTGIRQRFKVHLCLHTFPNLNEMKIH